MFEKCLYFNINALTRSVNRIWDEAFAEFELSPSHAYLLRLVLANPGLSPKQISQELQLERSTVSRFLDALEKKGLLKRKKRLKDDAREQGIYPSKKAPNITAALENKGEQLYQKMLSNLGKNNLTTLVAQLRITQNQLK